MEGLRTLPTFSRDAADKLEQCCNEHRRLGADLEQLPRILATLTLCDVLVKPKDASKDLATLIRFCTSQLRVPVTTLPKTLQQQIKEADGKAPYSVPAGEVDKATAKASSASSASPSVKLAKKLNNKVT